MSMKIFNDTIGRRARDLPSCSVVPQRTTPQRTPVICIVTYQMSMLMVQSRGLQGSNERITDRCCFEKEAEQSGLWPNWKYNPDFRLKRLTKCN